MSEVTIQKVTIATLTPPCGLGKMGAVKRSPAYLAGLIDGDGTIIIVRRDRDGSSKVLPFLMLKREQALNVLTFPQCRSRWDATPELRAEQYRRWVRQRELNSRYGRGRRSEVWLSKHAEVVDSEKLAVYI